MKLALPQSSHWGVFKSSAIPHVAPVDEEGYLLPGHVLTGDCPCEPEYAPAQEEDDNDLWIHHEIVT